MCNYTVHAAPRSRECNGYADAGLPLFVGQSKSRA
jgi:hypothetical protein